MIEKKKVLKKRNFVCYFVVSIYKETKPTPNDLRETPKNRIIQIK